MSDKVEQLFEDNLGCEFAGFIGSPSDIHNLNVSPKAQRMYVTYNDSRFDGATYIDHQILKRGWALNGFDTEFVRARLGNLHGGKYRTVLVYERL